MYFIWRANRMCDSRTQKKIRISTRSIIYVLYISQLQNIVSKYCFVCFFSFVFTITAWLWVCVSLNLSLLCVCLCAVYVCVCCVLLFLGENQCGGRAPGLAEPPGGLRRAEEPAPQLSRVSTGTVAGAAQEGGSSSTSGTF